VRSSYRAGRLYQQAVEKRESTGEVVLRHTDGAA
jgi:lipoic acid synthetase